MRSRLAIAVLTGILAALPDAPAHGVQRLDVSPGVGGGKTTFSFWYRDHGPFGSPGDEYLIVIGPRGTRCQGQVIFESIAGIGERERYRLGPKARYAPKRAESADDYFSRWCRGRYKIVIEYQSDPDEEAVTSARGRFRVR